MPTGPKRIDLKQSQLMLEAAPDAMIVIDTEGMIEIVNEAAERLFGYTREELLGHAIEVLVPQAAHARHVEHRREYVQHPTTRNMGSGRDLLGRRKDGTMLPVEISLRPVQTPEGLLVVAAIRDITEQRAAARELATEKERMQAATVGANLGLWDARLETGEILINEIFEQHLGYAPLALRESDDEWANLRGGLAAWPDLLHPEDRDLTAELIRQQVAGETETYRVEHRVRCGDGSYKWILSVGRTSERANGHATRVVGVHIDISEMKALQATLEHKYDELRQLQELRDNLTHMIVHDLRSPLTGIKLSLYLVKEEAHKLSTDTQECIDDASSATSTLVELISSLLDVNRFEAGEMPLNETDAELGALVDEALATLSGLTAGRLVGRDNKEVAVASRCDKELIRRVIANLVANALKFTPTSGTVAVTALAKAGRPRVEVRDTGPGIPAEFHARIFDKFGQVDAKAHRKRYSTGLGLAFCKLAVEAHGGTIGLESSVGNGSTFWFELPR